MTTPQITGSLNRWNNRQKFRQEMLGRKLGSTDYMSVLKSALANSKSDELQNIKLWSSAMLFKS